MRLIRPRSGSRLPLVLVFCFELFLVACGEEGGPSRAPQDIQLALSPPMGWNSWNRFHCNIDEELIRETADALVASGMRDAGYTFVNIDDCWQARERDAEGNLPPDPQRFPGGLRSLSDYVHRRGLKLGIYGSPGRSTCARSGVGSLDYEARDANNFAAWGIDYLKYDWCGADADGQQKIPAFTKMSEALKATGRPFVLAISEYGDDRPWLWGKETGAHLWRTTGDIFDNYISIMLIMNRQGTVAKYATQQGWNDPDMLEVGNGGMSDSEYKTHFNLWSVMNAPLLAGNDVRSMSDATKEILLNQEVIAVDQDWAGTPGTRWKTSGLVQVWGKPMSDGSFAAVVWNSGDSPTDASVRFEELGLSPAGPHIVRDLWSHTDEVRSGGISVSLAPHASAMYRIRAG